MKKNNPSTPILLREASGTLPKVYARYGVLRRQIKAEWMSRRELTASRVWSRTEQLIRRCEFSLEFVLPTPIFISFPGLSDKQIEDAVAALVKDGA